ncbi:MAG TPA: multidrug DMT transporter permease, partial [Bacteroidales bacterium]
MMVINSYLWAVVLCIVTMLCWGSWANTQKLASKEWTFQLFYWDYSLGVLFLSLILAFTMGSMGIIGRGFLLDLRQAAIIYIGLAILGGLVFNLANILLVVAIDIAGMAVAFPIGIGLALIIGVITNFIAVPVGDLILLFIGVGLIALAIIIDA